MQRAALVPKAPREDSAERKEYGLAKLVLILVETLRELMERQAMHRMQDGSLSDEEVERLGLAFMQLNQKMEELAKIFNVERRDLSLELGIFGEEDRNRTSLVDLLDSILEKGVFVLGDADLSVADVDLVNIQLRLVVNSIKKRRIATRKKSDVLK